MSDDTKHPDQQHIPTPAEVRAEHPTVLVPAHGDDEVRRIESHDGEHPAAAEPASTSAVEPTAEPVAPVEVAEPAEPSAPVVEIDSGRRREQEQDELAQVIAATAETVPGVHALGSPSARAVDSARTRLLGRTSVPGVNVLADDDVLNVEVSLVAEYPASVEEVADTVRADITSVLEARHSGPVDIDITVTDVHGPFDPADPDPGELIDGATAAIDDAKAKTGEAIGAAGDAAGKALDSAKATASDAADAARAGAANVADAAGDALEGLSKQRQESADDAAVSVSDGEVPVADAPTDTTVVAVPVADAPAADDDATIAEAPAATDQVEPATDGDLPEDLSEAAQKLAEAADALAEVAEEVTRGVDPSPADADADSGTDAGATAPAAVPGAASTTDPEQPSRSPKH
ncbi:Asp23/Gls24 family envelope stress response protein [Plantibacter sp. ME-Dv--P-095]|uniref:Asp23/Gls24 family envelope stress response protein n=1 Tax=Plantibacter sp. ME-Dv--P-095 TaxID=3040299 RepID=UPI00254EC180|nr:Asp23/Gls24 family envelope stress response protein [Plantibacter sp. ME-Dv--P-095]